MLLTSEAEQNWHVLETLAVILIMKQLLLHCNTQSRLGRIDLPNPKKFLSTFSDIALVQVFFVTATITTAVTGEEQNTGKNTEK